MEAYIQKIYDMMYSPILTPFNLVDNAKLGNYNYVKYYKSKNGLVAEMECLVDGSTKIFYYCFDERDYLQNIYVNNDGKKVLLFSREEEISTAKQKYYENQPRRVDAI